MSEAATEILNALTDRGYAAVCVNSDSRGDVFRIITTRGVTYERFKEAGQVAAWAVRHTPKEA